MILRRVIAAGASDRTFKGRSYSSSNTSNTSEARESEVFGGPLEKIWKSCIFDFCGVKTFGRTMFRVVADSDDAEQKAWLAQVKEILWRIFLGLHKFEKTAQICQKEITPINKSSENFCYNDA